jgi:hypothetical protein
MYREKIFVCTVLPKIDFCLNIRFATKRDVFLYCGGFHQRKRKGMSLDKHIRR